MPSMINVKRSARISSYAMAAAVVPISSADVLHNTLDQSFNLSHGESDVLQFTGLTVFTEYDRSLGPFSIAFSIDATMYLFQEITVSRVMSRRVDGVLR